MLAPLIAALVPVLIAFIQTLIPAASATNQQQHSWVQGFFQDVVTALGKFIPSWLAPEMSAITTLVSTLVQAELDKLLPVS